VNSSNYSTQIARALIHPDFKRDNNENDIAIITLQTNIIFSSRVQPVCLWKSDKIDLQNLVGKPGTVVGWGLTEKGQISNALQEAKLPVVTTLTCLRSNRDLFGRLLTDGNFCAGTLNGSLESGCSQYQ